MAVIVYANCLNPFPLLAQSRNPNFNFRPQTPKSKSKFCPLAKSIKHRSLIVNELGTDPEQNNPQGNEDNLGVKAALSVLRFYKREISPLLPKSCRYVPTCSEYSMEAYKKYGVAKGTILTAWRLCRCNPLGGSGFDPPRWFDETSPPEE